ncbi:MAG: hypothetical protein WAL97_08040 [Halobacteriota archaeon]
MSRRHRERRSASSKDVVWAAGVPIGKVSVSSCPLPCATVGPLGTLTANIKSGTTTMGKPVYRFLGGVRYNDTTIFTDASGKSTFTQKWTRAGTRPYNAKLATPGKKTLTSAAVTIRVHWSIDARSSTRSPRRAQTVWVCFFTSRDSESS